MTDVTRPIFLQPFSAHTRRIFPPGAQHRTSRFYGRNEALIKEVGVHRVGRLKPNDFGLFEMLGNVREWCQNPVLAGRIQVMPVSEDEVGDKVSRVSRGGAFNDFVTSLRSANRFYTQPVAAAIPVFAWPGRSPDRVDLVYNAPRTDKTLSRTPS